MKKPHEQEWKKDERRPGVIRVSEHLTLEVRADLGAMLEDEGSMMREVEAVVACATAAPDMARALLPLARFVEAFDAKPVRGIGDVLYGIHGGDGASEYGADVRLSDLRKAVAALKKAGVLP